MMSDGRDKNEVFVKAGQQSQDEPVSFYKKLAHGPLFFPKAEGTLIIKTLDASFSTRPLVFC